MNPKVFGFKTISQGSHTLIAGHVETKDGNIEFSTAFDHSDLQSLMNGLSSLNGSLSNLYRYATCYHGEWELIDANSYTVRCRRCGITTACTHKHYSTEDYSKPDTEQVRVCNTCHLNFKVDANGKVISNQPAA